MVDERHEVTHQVEPDRELSVSGILWTAVGIIVVTAVAMVLMWYVSKGLKSGIESADRPPTPAELEELGARRAAGEERLATEPMARPRMQIPADFELPPEPRLEIKPGYNYQQLQKEEQRVLTTYEWVDEAAGVVRIPIELAIERAAAEGLPPAGPPPPAEAAAADAAGTAAVPGAQGGTSDAGG